MGPEALAHVLRPLAGMFPASAFPALLVGLDGADDAAVYQLADDLAIVVTTDFFTPVVDDPYAFGAIAAANAMSDVFAMGGEVLLALNLVAFPDDLSAATVEAIIRGGAEAVRAAGGVVAGGHSVTDPEPKYGLAVVGRVDPARILRKAGARVGDVLLLTKPLGTGLVSTALKHGVAAAEDVEAATRSMAALNRLAGRAASSARAHAATDITGFGLVGHGLEMADASGVALRFECGLLPLLPGALRHATAGHAPGGTDRNAATFAPRLTGEIAEPWRNILFDPQTSGGLLVALPPDRVDAFRADVGPAAVIVGRVVAGRGVEIG